MSRSFKKNPVVTDGDSGKVGKRFAKRKVRRYKDTISNGKMYRKIYESWDIHDYTSRETLNHNLLDYESCLLAFLNGGSVNDPKNKKWYSYKYWYITFKRK
jgi:hypothetical protein